MSKLNKPCTAIPCDRLDIVNAFKPRFVSESLSSLMGVILTIIDASISDQVQNKAIKDIIKKEFNILQLRINHLAFDINMREFNESEYKSDIPYDSDISSLIAPDENYLVPYDLGKKYKSIN